MTVEFLRSELKKMIVALTTSGFGNIDAGMVEKLDKISIISDKLGMREGKRLIDNLSETMKSILEGKTGAESGKVRLMALEFYVDKLAGEENTEEL